MLNQLTDSLNFHATALTLRSERQRLIASNIANADTPHYKARDLDFKSALESAMGGKAGAGGPVELARTSSGHIGAKGNGGAFEQAMKYRTETQSSVDGNTVDMDIERSAFAENSLLWWRSSACAESPYFPSPRRAPTRSCRRRSTRRRGSSVPTQRCSSC